MQTSATANPAGMLEIAGGNGQVLPEDIDEMLASILPRNTPVAADRNSRRKAPRFRVRWHADILIDGRNIDHGFVSDIFTDGACVYLNNNVHPLKPTLRIHIPPLNSTSRPHIIEVSGKTVYIVYDGDKQMYRASISFTRFRVETDVAYLDERLNKYHPRIPEH